MPDRQLLLQARDLRERAEEVLASSQDLPQRGFPANVAEDCCGLRGIGCAVERRARNADDVDTV